MLNHRITSLVLLLALCALVLAQDAAPEVKMPDAIVQADARYEKAVQEAQVVRLRVYEREMQNATRAGNLDLANAIKARMEGMKDPDSEPRTLQITVPATRNRTNPVIVAQVKRGDRITITPVGGKWSGGGTKEGVFTDWRGYPDRPGGWMTLNGSLGEKSFPVLDTVRFRADQDGDLGLYCEDDKPRRNQGQIQVSVTIK